MQSLFQHLPGLLSKDIAQQEVVHYSEQQKEADAQQLLLGADGCLRAHGPVKKDKIQTMWAKISLVWNTYFVVSFSP